MRKTYSFSKDLISTTESVVVLLCARPATQDLILSQDYEVGAFWTISPRLRMLIET